jgi:hypothetical protein
MKYDCGHLGCDVCGGRQCNGVNLKLISIYMVCDYCIAKAVRLAVHVSEEFSTYVDVTKPCALTPHTPAPANKQEER